MVVAWIFFLPLLVNFVSLSCWLPHIRFISKFTFSSRISIIYFILCPCCLCWRNLLTLFLSSYRIAKVKWVPYNWSKWWIESATLVGMPIDKTKDFIFTEFIYLGFLHHVQYSIPCNEGLPFNSRPHYIEPWMKHGIPFPHREIGLRFHALWNEKTHSTLQNGFAHFIFSCYKYCFTPLHFSFPRK